MSIKVLHVVIYDVYTYTQIKSNIIIVFAIIHFYVRIKNEVILKI